MSSTQIVNVMTYNPATDISYAKPKINQSQGKNVAIINSTVKKATYLSTPLMLTWGMSEFVDDKTGKKTYELSLQFPSSEYPDPDGEVFLKKMKEFEDKVKADAIIYSKEWFNKPKMSADVVDALFTPMLKYPKNKESGEFDYARPPTLRLKVPFWEDEWKIELYDVEQRQIWPSADGSASTPVELIPKLTRVACVIQCGGIWFAAGKFGVTWRLFQAVVKPPQSLRGKCHIRLTEGDKERIAASGPSNTGNSGFDADTDDDENGATGTVVQDSDDDEPAPTPAPQPVVEAVAAPARKTIVRKKKNAKGDDDE
jgi:hypothetical protein